MPEDSPKIPNYLRPDWTIGPDLPSPEYDPGLEKEIEAYVSWQTIRQEFGNVIVEFQLLESALKDAISHLSGPTADTPQSGSIRQPVAEPGADPGHRKKPAEPTESATREPAQKKRIAHHVPKLTPLLPGARDI